MKQLSLILICLLLLNSNTDAQSKKPQVFKAVDVMPEFPGGEAALYKYLSTNINYPDSAMKYGKEGSVRVKFIVDEEGNIIIRETTNINLGYGLEEEAKRVIAGMPKWKPGRNNDTPVKVYYQIPIRFSLDNGKKEKTERAENLFRMVEQMPEFNGGDMALQEYLKTNIQYPDSAREKGLEAKVLVQFIVNEDGSIAGTETLRPAGNGFDEEAIRVINTMPYWKPGKQNGIPVRVYYTLPIYFKLSDKEER